MIKVKINSHFLLFMIAAFLLLSIHSSNFKYNQILFTKSNQLNIFQSISLIDSHNQFTNQTSNCLEFLLSNFIFRSINGWHEPNWLCLIFCCANIWMIRTLLFKSWIFLGKFFATKFSHKFLENKNYLFKELTSWILLIKKKIKKLCKGKFDKIKNFWTENKRNIVKRN